MSRNRVRVLIAIGNQSSREAVRNALLRSESTQFQVSVAENLASALEMVSQGTFDAAMIDLELPDANGHELVARLRERAPRIPITLIVTIADRERGKKALAQGAQNLAAVGHFDEVSVSWIVECAIEKKNMEEMNKTLKVVNSLLRHDILNNLTVVGGSLEIYKIKKEDRFLQSASAAVDRSVDLIKKMKEVEATISPKEMKEMDVRQMIEEIVKKYAGYKIGFSIAGSGSVLADEALSSVFDNIINNAVIHSGSPVVSISIRPGVADGSLTEIRIADEGIGIPNEIKPRIWQEGFKYGKSGQTGLGLFIVKRILERYGGTISVEDNVPRGTVFVVRLLSK